LTQFTVFDGAVSDLFIVVQAVDDAPRHHRNIETSDLVAEVARFTALDTEPVTR